MLGMPELQTLGRPFLAALSSLDSEIWPVECILVHLIWRKNVSYEDLEIGNGV